MFLIFGYVGLVLASIGAGVWLKKRKIRQEIANSADLDSVSFMEMGSPPLVSTRMPLNKPAPLKTFVAPPAPKIEPVQTDNTANDLMFMAAIAAAESMFDSSSSSNSSFDSGFSSDSSSDFSSDSSSDFSGGGGDFSGGGSSGEW